MNNDPLIKGESEPTQTAKVMIDAATRLNALIKSFESNEEWGWCYVDEVLLESVPGSLTTEWCGVLGATA